MTAIHLRRSLHFVPGANEKMFLKSLASGADSLILDLEDAVTPQKKGDARQVIRDWLKSADFGGDLGEDIRRAGVPVETSLVRLRTASARRMNCVATRPTASPSVSPKLAGCEAMYCTTVIAEPTARLIMSASVAVSVTHAIELSNKS